uniref:Uncharacterized protein n=1 Tax=Arundo donax TaxID=35708 RepID=A0A0A9AQW1_ARUDO
MGAVPMKACG